MTDLEKAAAVLMDDLVKARDRRAPYELVRMEFEKHIETTEALISAARERDAMREALTEIINQCPATCEISPAHIMADIARQALNQEQPA